MQFPGCLQCVSFRRYSALSLEVTEKYEHKLRPQNFYDSLFVWFTSYRIGKFSWVLFADLCVRILAMKQNAEFMEDV